jgi:hypothetical protein
VTRAPLLLPLLLLGAGLALAPAAARGQTLDPSPLGSGNPCFDTSQVAASMSFGDPNDPDGGFFTHLRDCTTLCKKAGVSCAKFAKRAAACGQRFADDRARLNVAVHCDGMRGTDLKTCSGPYQSERASERADASDALAAELSTCATRATDCAGKCDAAH